MDTTYKQEVRVGALVLFGFATFIALLFWLTDRRVGAQGVRVTVRFDNVAGLDQGDPVMVSGVKVGRVEGVRLLRGGKVDVILNVTRDQRPRIDATAAIAALDFLGSKFIKYSPGVGDDRRRRRARRALLAADNQDSGGDRTGDAAGGLAAGVVDGEAPRLAHRKSRDAHQSSR